VAKHSWSSYQAAVFDEVETGKGHMLITARAGCAKTTTIVEAANRLDGSAPVLMCAFNKEIAEELGRRVLGHIDVKTTHGLGLKALQKAWNIGKLAPDAQRERDVFKKVLPRLVYENAEIRGDLMTLVRMAKAFVVEDNQGLERLMQKYDCAPAIQSEKAVPQYCDWARMLLAEFRKPNPTITFDDMLYVPAYLNLSGGRFEYVFVDETQDLNVAQLTLAQNSISNTGRLIFVGDDRQAIYAFRGADENIIPNIRARFTPKELMLTRTYRCPQKIVAYAQRYVPDFESDPSAPSGVLERVTDVFMKKNWQAGDFVIARVNVVLVSLCLEALAAGIPSYMVGRDIGAGLIKLIDRSKADTIEELVAWVREWQQGEMQKLVAAEEDESKINNVADRANSLIRLARERRTVTGLKMFIRDLFGEEKKGIERDRLAFMSTHKAKGLENPRVWLIDSTYRPGRSQEEDNLYYVGMTRAQRELYLVSLTKKKEGEMKPMRNEIGNDLENEERYG